MPQCFRAGHYFFFLFSVAAFGAERVYLPDESCHFGRGREEVSIATTLRSISDALNQMERRCPEASKKIQELSSSVKTHEAAFAKQLAALGKTDASGMRETLVPCGPRLEDYLDREKTAVSFRLNRLGALRLPDANPYSKCNSLDATKSQPCIERVREERGAEVRKSCDSAGQSEKEAGTKHAEEIGQLIETVGEETNAVIEAVGSCLAKSSENDPLVGQSVAASAIQIGNMLTALQPMSLIATSGIAVGEKLFLKLVKHVLSKSVRYDAHHLADFELFQKEACAYEKLWKRLTHCTADAFVSAGGHNGDYFQSYVWGNAKTKSTGLKPLSEAITQARATGSNRELLNDRSASPLLDRFSSAMESTIEVPVFTDSKWVRNQSLTVFEHLKEVERELELTADKNWQSRNKWSRNLKEQATSLNEILSSYQLLRDAVKNPGPSGSKDLSLAEGRLVLGLRARARDNTNPAFDLSFLLKEFWNNRSLATPFAQSWNRRQENRSSALAPDEAVQLLNEYFNVAKTQMLPLFEKELEVLSRRYDTHVIGGQESSTPTGRHFLGHRPAAPRKKVNLDRELGDLFDGNVMPLMRACTYLASAFVLDEGSSRINPLHSLAESSWFGIVDPTRLKRFRSMCGKLACKDGSGITLFKEQSFASRIEQISRFKSQQCDAMTSIEAIIVDKRRQFIASGGRICP